MKIKYFLVAAVVTLMTVCGMASKVPLTGHTHRISISDVQLLSLSNQEYTGFMASTKRSADAKNTTMVQRVGHSLANVVETYLRSNGYVSEINSFKWEFSFVQDKQTNAFYMPGGKIIVYEGLLPYTQNEASLAIVLDHEITHAVAKHNTEQIIKQMDQQVGINTSDTVLNSTADSGVGDIASQVVGGHFSFRNLKYSRNNESEVDYMGPIFAAAAGYDPTNAVTFWRRMAAATNSSRSEILNDRPFDTRRAENIKKWLPEAERYHRSHGSSRVSSMGYSQSSGTLHIGGSSSSKHSDRC